MAVTRRFFWKNSPRFLFWGVCLFAVLALLPSLPGHCKPAGKSAAAGKNTPAAPAGKNATVLPVSKNATAAIPGQTNATGPDGLLDPEKLFGENPDAEFYDFEEANWYDRSLDILIEKQDLRQAGNKNTDYYDVIGYMNLALGEGNAYTAAMLIYGPYQPKLPSGKFTNRLADPAFWETYADSLTSKGWTRFIHAAESSNAGHQDRYLLEIAAETGHPAAKYWHVRFGSYSVPNRTALMAESVNAGYAYAQAEAAAASCSPSHYVWSKPLRQNCRMYGELGLRAARQGEVNGFAYTGNAYYEGYMTGKPDPETAGMYYTLADMASDEEWRMNALSLKMLRPGYNSDGGVAYPPVRGLGLTPEQIASSEQRAKEWAAQFRQRRQALWDAARAKRAKTVAAMREEVKEDYLAIYNALKQEGHSLPPSLYDQPTGQQP